MVHFGADANCASYDSQYPLLWACEVGSQEMVDMLAPHSGRALHRLTHGTLTAAKLHWELRHGYGRARGEVAHISRMLSAAGCGLVP